MNDRLNIYPGWRRRSCILLHDVGLMCVTENEKWLHIPEAVESTIGMNAIGVILCRFTNEGEMTMTTTTVVKDPVCGMDIEAASADGQTEHKAQTYYFCGSNCKEKFDLNPEQYLSKSGETPKSGHGCCA